MLISTLMKKNVHRLLFRLLLIFTFSHFQISTSAQDSSRLRISLLTVAPGEELYATFGHSALRVTDSNSVTDHVYNYGTFDFDDKDFYLKFIRGKLLYYVSVEQFYDFKNDNALENRAMTEQVLNLSGEEKTEIRRALIENIKPENKFYLYDFFLDNCTTRLRDIIVKYHQPKPELPAVMPATYTFRNAIHLYLDKNHKDWSKFGIDILLGAPCDALMTKAQQQFLPDNLMKALDSTTNTTIVSSSQNLYATDNVKNEKIFFTPFVFFASVLLFFILLSIFPDPVLRRILHGFDGLLFFSVGMLGIILVLMWVATDHIMTKNNYNLLWAWPMHIVYAFFINKNSKRVKTYSLIAAVFLILLLCSWFFLAQQMSNALIPLVLLLIWRSGAKIFMQHRS